MFLEFADFALLEPGDELIIHQGCPTADGELQQSITVTVATVAGNSFLTTNGDGYGACHAQGYVYKTGKKNPVTLSDKAKQVFDELGLQIE